DEAEEVIEEYYPQDLDGVDDHCGEQEEMDITESNIPFYNNHLINLSNSNNLNQTVTREPASFVCNSSQVYSEKSEERSSQESTGLGASELVLFDKSNQVTHAVIKSQNNLNNISIANDNQVYSEQSEKRSSQEPTGVDESKLESVDESDKISRACNLTNSSSSNLNIVTNNDQVCFEQSEELISQESTDLDESKLDLFHDSNTVSHISLGNSESSISGININDREDSEQSEISSDSEFTDSDKFGHDKANDDIFSEYSFSSSVSDHDDVEFESNFVDNDSDNDLEQESEKSPENSSSPLQNCDSHNDAQNNTEASSSEKPTDIESIISGCRIVELAHFIKEFTKLGDSKNHLPNCARQGENFHCFRKLDVGLNTLLYWKCLECKMIATFWTNPVKQENKFDINETAAISVIGSASSFAAFQTILAVFNIPCITNKTYEKHRKKLVEPLRNVLAEEMHKNALEEAQIAIKNGDVTPDGIPLVKVITDGVYDKRSYRGGKHDSLGASVAVIGCATQKVIDVEVVNKYCYTCRVHQNRNCEPPAHKCFMNYDRKKSSSSMEPHATAILFNRSLKLHGIIYSVMVSDDDTDIERLRKDFESESLSKAEKQKIFEENTEVLRKNILLAPLHVFGDHAQCPTEWSCDKSKSNHLPKIKEYGLYSRIEKIITDLSQNAIHLLHFLNTNKIEQYHGVLAKYFSGKRIQYGGADEFHDRVYMGTLDQITSGAHLSTFYKFVKKSVPERIVKLEKERNSQRQINTKCREINKQQKKNRRTYHGPDKDYGSNAAQPDLCETDPVNYQQYKEDHHDKLRELINDIYNPVMYDDDVLLSMENHRVKALQLLESKISHKIERCGIFVSDDVESFYLCARPDGLVNDDSIVIVVNLSDDEQIDVETALKNNRNMNNLFDKKAANNINKNHPIYYIIQGQLHVTNRQFCYFAVFTPNHLKISELVSKDDDFWENKIKNKLNKFYYSALIDEIVDSRLARSMPIREAAFTIEARAKKSQKDADKLAKKAKQPSDAQNGSVNSSTSDHDEETLNNYRALVVNRPIEDFADNILEDKIFLDDLSISRFVLLLEEKNFTTDFPVTAVNPLKQSTSSNDLVIIGGEHNFLHWSCLYFD
ncbi:GSCOCG00009254001-RA-CDS, partial [Cotesia congregata]